MVLKGKEGQDKARLERILKQADVPTLASRDENYRDLLLSPDLYFPFDPATDGTAIWFDLQAVGESSQDFHDRVHELKYTHMIPEWLQPRHEGRGNSHHYYCVVCDFHKSRSDQVSNHVRGVHLRYFYKCPEAICAKDEELWMAKEHVFRGCDSYRAGEYPPNAPGARSSGLFKFLPFRPVFSIHPVREELAAGRRGKKGGVTSAYTPGGSAAKKPRAPAKPKTKAGTPKSAGSDSPRRSARVATLKQ